MFIFFKEFKREYPEFMPGPSVKNFWLFTLKKEANIQSATMPGLFQSVNYSLLLAGFALIIILEGAATKIASVYGVSLMAILAAIVVDIILAVISHIYHGKICLLKNKLFIEETKQKRDQINRSISNLKWWSWFWYTIILFSGLFKFYWFYIVYKIYLIPFGLNYDAYSILVFFCYFVASWLHIFCTGYVFYTSYFHYRIHKEERKYIYLPEDKLLDDNSLRDKRNPRPITANVELIPVKEGSHSLYKDEKDGKYYLETLGIFLDEELRRMIDRQHNADQRRTLAQEGVRIQLDILNK